MTTATLPIVERRARLGAYTRWHFRDFIALGVLSAVLFGLLGALQIMQMQTAEAMMAARKMAHGIPLASKLSQFLGAYGLFAFLAPIICVSGLVSNDRQLGYTRFLFAKPLSVRAYYFNLLLARFVGFLALGTVLVLAYSYFEPPSYNWRFLVEMTVSFVAVGGIVFLLSVVSRYDGLLAILFLLVATFVRARWETTPSVGHAFTFLFPPVDQAGVLRRWAVGIDLDGQLGAVPFPWRWTLWNGGYGLAWLLLGLYLLRRVPLTKA
jgi:hypothetical protein